VIPELKGSLEENILTLIGWDDQRAPALLLRLDPALFSTRIYREIAQEAYKHITRYGSAPHTHLYDLLEERLQRGDEGKLMRQTLDQMRELAAEIQPRFVLDQLDHFIELRTMSVALVAASEALSRGDTRKAREALYNRAMEQNNTAGTWLAKPEQSLRFMDKRDEDWFPSGVDVLDNAGVVPARGAVYMMIAPAKRGKSWFLIETGKQAMQHNHRVLHVTLEMPEEQVAQRYVQSVFALTATESKLVQTINFDNSSHDGTKLLLSEPRMTESITDIGRARLTPQVRALSQRGALLIKQFPSGSLTVAQLDAYLDSLARTDKFVPDVVLLDYPALMAVDSSNYRIDIGRVAVGLRGQAIRRNHALVTVAQGNRSASSALRVDRSHVAEDFSQIMTADTVLTYSQTEAEKKLGLARLFVDAARSVRDGFTVMISQNYETGQFAIDSTRMDGHIEAAVKKLSEPK
jgi:hypothetical protein